jgi:hypothetical protein
MDAQKMRARDRDYEVFTLGHYFGYESRLLLDLKHIEKNKICETFIFFFVL